MGGLLFINGGESWAQACYNAGLADWGQALPIVLEKHGFLDVTVAGGEALQDLKSWSAYGAVIVGRLPPGAWRAETVKQIVAMGLPVFIDGPLPECVERALGLTRQGAEHGSFSLSCVDARLRTAAARYATAVGGVVRPAGTRIEGLEPSSYWDELPVIGISERRAETWRAAEIGFTRWTADGAGTVLCTAARVPSGLAHPAIVSDGSLTGCAFGLFDHLVRSHTAAPVRRSERRLGHRTEGLEGVLLGCLDLLHEVHGRHRVRLRPWPAGQRWTRSVRHDFDRPLSVTQVRETLRAHAMAGTSATWYWRAEPRYKPCGSVADRRELVAAAVVDQFETHEVALHCERLWEGAAAEREVVEAAIGRRVTGMSIHGGRGSFRWQGAPNVLWAEQQGLEYTELLEQGHRHLHRFVALQEDGSVTPLHVLCVPHHVAFDRSAPGETHGEAVEGAIADWIAVGGFVQLMNHPDINQRSFFELVDRLPVDGRGDLTAGQAARWWRRTHVRGELEVDYSHRNRKVRLWSRLGVRDLSVEVLAPDGAIRAETICISPGETRSLKVE